MDSAATNKGDHPITVTLVSFNDSGRTMTIRSADGAEKTVPISEKAAAKLRKLGARPGDTIVVICTDKETGEHEIISDVDVDLEWRNQTRFRWPPPEPSASRAVPQSMMANATTLGTLDSRISAAFDACGYVARTYFPVPGGYAMTTQVEQIRPDGVPLESSLRWSIGPRPLSLFSLDYLSALIGPKRGMFRAIVFIASAFPYPQSSDEFTEADARAWSRDGASNLPSGIKRLKFDSSYSCTLLVYEFERGSDVGAVATSVPGKLSIQTHLEKSQLWKQLQVAP